MEVVDGGTDRHSYTCTNGTRGGESGDTCARLHARIIISVLVCGLNAPAAATNRINQAQRVLPRLEGVA